MVSDFPGGGRKQGDTPLRTLPTKLPTLFFCCDGTGSCTWRNGHWEEHTGQSPAAGLGFGWLERIHPDDRSFTLAEWNKTPGTMEYVVEHRVWIESLQEYRWHETNATSIDVESNLNWIGSSTSIHHLREAQDQLIESERKLRTLVEGVPQLLWRSCDRGEWTWSSPQWLTYTGQSQEETHGRGWLAPVHPADRPATIAAWEAARATGYVDVEFRLKRLSDGKYLYHRTLSKPLLDDAKRIVEWLGSTTDIQSLKDDAWKLQKEIAERRTAEERLQFIAFHDDLTKLRSRRYFVDCLQRTLSNERSQSCRPCAVLFLDLDRFKLINDSLGHQVGDKVLVIIASRLTDCVTSMEILARFGGDEFAVLIPELRTAEQAVEVARCIADAVREPMFIDGNQIFSSCSVGVVICGGHKNPEEMLRDADIALYKAKAVRGGGHVIFEPEMGAAAVEALDLRTDLQNAVTRGELVIEYQPICAASDSQATGAEALVRWNHPHKGLLPPSTFIGLAEEAGLICEIGQFVLKEACHQMFRWLQEFPERPLRLSVNASGQEINSPGYVSSLEEILVSTGFPPESLEIEITESIFLERPDEVGATLRQIRKLGVRVALDDFGTGFSSLNYLDKFEVTTVKIDRSFVGRMLSHTRTLAIIRTIVALGEDLNFDIVAEGVEENAQLAELQLIGCGFVQGYLFGAPMSGPEFSRFIRLDASQRQVS